MLMVYRRRDAQGDRLEASTSEAVLRFLAKSPPGIESSNARV